MAKDGTTAIERFARTQHTTAERWLQSSFRAKLTAEDVSDVLGKVYEEALVSASHLPDDELRPWFYTAARHRAIDAIRRREGEGSSKRSMIALEESDVDGVDPLVDEDRHAAVIDADADLANALCVHRALEAMPATEREVLRLSAVDGLSIRTTAELLGLSKKVVETTRARALERFKSLVGAPVDELCGRARALIEPGRLVDPQLAHWRDAHLAGCIGCQVQGDRAYGKRLQGLAPLLPVAYPTAGRLQALLGRLTNLPPEAASVGATAGTTGAGTLAGMVGGSAAKVAALAAVGAAAVSVSAPALPRSEPPRPRSAAPSIAAAAPAAPTPAPKPTSLERPLAGEPAGERRPRRRRPATSRTRASTPVTKPARPAEYSPESFQPAAASPTAAEPDPPVAAPSTASPQPPVPPPSSGDAFAGEFSP